jgi:hypothetical protein
MARRVATLKVEVLYDPEVTDAESLASALDTLMETALSTPGILDEYGVVDVGDFYVLTDKPVRRRR